MMMKEESKLLGSKTKLKAQKAAMRLCKAKIRVEIGALFIKFTQHAKLNYARGYLKTVPQ